MGGVESGFQFLSYKCDRLSLEVTQDFRSLLFTGPLGPDQVDLSIAFRHPVHASADRSYVGGIEIEMSLFFSKDRAPKERIALAKVGISGLFKVVGGELKDEMVQHLVKVQIPAILFPYARTALTVMCASAGLPGLILPLVNVQELAKNAAIQISELTPGMPPQTLAPPSSASPRTAGSQADR